MCNCKVNFVVTGSYFHRRLKQKVEGSKEKSVTLCGQVDRVLNITNYKVRIRLAGARSL